ncbi:ion transporter [Chloroflexota bacterium]
MSRRTMTEVIIGILAIVSIILVAVESLASVSEGTLMGIYIADLIICIVFAWDFVLRLRSSQSKPRFIKTNGFEVLAMIPAIALYALGTIPAIAVAFRSLRFIRVVRIVLLLARMRRVMSKSGKFVQRSNLLALFGITVSVIFVGAFAALILDRGTENAQITNFSDAVWWSISTITTVGYGDIVPHSIAGRIMGMVLMVVGIGVMAGFISQVSATLVESRMKRNEEDGIRTSIVTEIKNRIDRIEKLSESEVALLIQMIQTLRLTGGE